MSSDRRRLRWWHWLLLVVAAILILVWVLSYTLQPAVIWTAG